MRTRLDDRPAFAPWQGYDPVYVRCSDAVPRTGWPLDILAVPAAVRTEQEDLLDIPARQDNGLERPGMIVRIGMGLRVNKAVQCPTIVQMIFDESPGHSLGTNDRRPVRSVFASD